MYRGRNRSDAASESQSAEPMPSCCKKFSKTAHSLPAHVITWASEKLFGKSAGTGEILNVKLTGTYDHPSFGLQKYVSGRLESGSPDSEACRWRCWRHFDTLG